MIARNYRVGHKWYVLNYTYVKETDQWAGCVRRLAVGDPTQFVTVQSASTTEVLLKGLRRACKEDAK